MNVLLEQSHFDISWPAKAHSLFLHLQGEDHFWSLTEHTEW